MLSKYLYIAVAFPLLFASCKGFDKSRDNSKPLAKVFGQYLYSSDIEPDLIPDGISPEDSARIMDVYIENWVRKQLLLRKAEAFASSNPEIDRLVRDYYNSLIVQQYENALVRERLDSVITQEQYVAYYEKNKEQYVLENAHVRCYYIKAANSTPALGELRAIWRNGAGLDFNKVLVFCNANKNTVEYSLEENKWTVLESLMSKLPPDALTTWHLAGNDYVESDSAYTYFVRLFEHVPAGSIAPLSFVSKDIADVLLYERRGILLDSLAKELYQEAAGNGDLEVIK